MTKKKTAKPRKPTRFQNLVTRIERTNRAFKKAGRAKQIMMVAEDVLEMLKLKRLTATSGTYVSLPEIPQVDRADIKDVSEFLKMPKLPSCEVCAIGAVMVASTIRLDRVPILAVKGAPDEMQTQAYFMRRHGAPAVKGTLGSGMSKRALDVFPELLLGHMESAFEEQEYGYNIESDAARLTSIYKNLLKNDGKKFTNRINGREIWPKFDEDACG